MKLLEKNRVTLHYLELGNTVPDSTSKAKAQRKKIDKLNFKNLITLCIKGHCQYVVPQKN